MQLNSIDKIDLPFEENTPYAHITYAVHRDNPNCHFAVFYLRENHYSQGKGKLLYLTRWTECSKYTALCEGDDYWIHPHKLQMQVDFMESHHDVGLLRTNVRRFEQESGLVDDNYFSRVQIKDTFNDYLIHSWWAAPCTWLYRWQDYKDSFLGKDRKELSARKAFTGDIAVLLSISRNKRVAMLPVTTSVYRILQSSASHFNTLKETNSFYRKIDRTRHYFAKQSTTKVWLSVHFNIVKNHIVVFLSWMRNKF